MIDTTSVKIVNTSWMQQGQTCWVPVNEVNKLKQNTNNPPLFIRAIIQKLNGNRSFARVVYMEQHKGPDDVAVKDLQRGNTDYEKHPDGWKDLVQMNIINDPETIGNIKSRYKKQFFYTYADRLLISCGVKASDDIASLRTLNEYKLSLFDRETSLKAITPHVFSMLYLAYTNMDSREKPQQLVFSGLSGSGKSTNIRACLKLLSKLSEDTHGSKQYTFEEGVTSTHKLLQVLGTAGNNIHAYSTRYMINYKFAVNPQNKKISGMIIQPIFLETSRLWSTQKGQGFFIFYFLKNPTIQGQIPVLSQFKDILAGIQQNNDAFQNNEEDYNNLFPSLLKTGYKQNEIDAFARVLVAVAFLCSGGTQGQKLSEILQAPELSNIDLTNEKNRMDIAQSLYVKVFNWAANTSSGSSVSKNARYLCLLENGGLEYTCKQGTYFEQILANYGAERVDQLYNRYTFKNTQEDFQNEKLHDLAKSIVFQDNQDIINFYETQIFNSIRETDEQTYQSIVQASQSHQLFQVQGGLAFIIQHSLGSVQYNVEQFGIKNQCKVLDEFQTKLQSTGSQELKQILLEDTINNGTSHTATMKQQVDSFCHAIDQCDQIFIKCISASPNQNGEFKDSYVLQQLHEQNVLESIKFQKTSYTSRMSYQEYYKRYHELDSFNKKISLQKHLTMGTDLRGLIIEMNKRIFPKLDKRAVIYGENFIYMKGDAGYQLEGLLHDWNKKLDTFATKIQVSFKVSQFRDNLKQSVRKLSKFAKQNPEAKGQFAEIVAGQETVFLQDPEQFSGKIKKTVQQSQGLQQQQPVQLKVQEVEDPLSDKEAYSLLTENQKEEYKKQKIVRKAAIKNATQQGKVIDGEFDEPVSVSILTQEQKQQYIQKRIAMGYREKQQPQVAQEVVYEISDPESYAILEQNQRQEYSQVKQQRETAKKSAILQGKIVQDGYLETVAFSLLTNNQKDERKKRVYQKEKARRMDEMAQLIAEDGFLSDSESFAYLQEEQKFEYIQKKKENELIKESNQFEGKAQQAQESIAFSMLSPQLQKQVKKLKKDKAKKTTQLQALVAMEAFLSDPEAYAQLTLQQTEIYKEQKLEQSLSGQNPLEQLNKQPVSYSLLNEEQKEARRKLKLQRDQSHRRQSKQSFAVQEDVSDPESLAYLSDIQKTQYKQQKEEKINIKKEMNALKYGYEGVISDPESLKLLDGAQKKQWQKSKEQQEKVLKSIEVAKNAGVGNISDNEAYALLDVSQRDDYIQQKLDQKTQLLQQSDQSNEPSLLQQQPSIADQLLTQEQRAQKDENFNEKLIILREMDESGITPLIHDTNIDLTNSQAYKLLTPDQKLERKQKQFELEKQRRSKLQGGQFAVPDDVAESIAFSQLSVLQREERKKKEINKERMKNIINPILFAEDIDEDQSVAFALLTSEQKDLLYKQDNEKQKQPEMKLQQLGEPKSKAFSLLNDKQKQERNKKVQQQAKQMVQLGGDFQQVDSDISDGQIVQIQTLEQKKQAQQQKIEKQEQDKINYAVQDHFSDYEAFLILDEEQKQEWKDQKQKGPDPNGVSVAYKMLEQEQKVKLRKRKAKKVEKRKRKMKRKYGVEGEISDIDSFLQLTEVQKQEYSKYKQDQHAAVLSQNQVKYGIMADLSDEGAIAMLNEVQQQDYKKIKAKKLNMQKEMAKQGFVVEFADEAEQSQIFTLKEFDDREKKIAKIEKTLEDEEKAAQDELFRKEEEKQAQMKKHGNDDQQVRAKRPTLLKKMGIDPNMKCDDFKTKGIDIWPLEATVYMKPMSVIEAQKQPVVGKLIQNPDLQPYNIGKTQLKKRLLDPTTAVECVNEIPQVEDYDKKFLDRVRSSKFFDYCEKRIVRNKQYGKKDKMDKIMKYSTDNLQEPLIAIDELRFEKAKQMFRSLIKVGHFKRSRFTPKQHQDKILVGVLGSGCMIELPQLPVRLQRAVTEKLERFQKRTEQLNREKQLEGDSDEEKADQSPKKGGKSKAEEDKIKKDEKLKWNELDSSKTYDQRIFICTQSPIAKLREEAYLQICKQLGQNKTKEQVSALVKFGVVLSSVMAPSSDAIFPILNFLLEKLETDKLYKDADVNRFIRQWFRNFSRMAQSLMLLDKTKLLTQLFPSQVEPQRLSLIYDPSKGEQQLIQKERDTLAEVRILKSDKEPLIAKFFKIGQGLNSITDIQYYSLQNILPRRYLPNDDEQILMESVKQVVVKLYLFSETPIWISIDHCSLVHEVTAIAVKYIGKENLASFFALQLVIRDNNQVQGERYLENDEKFLDILNFHEFTEKVQTENYKQNKSFQIYLRIRVYYRLFKNDLDSVDLFYFQQVYEFKRNRYPIKPSDALLLAAIELFQKYGKHDANRVETTQAALEKLIDQLIPQKLLNGSFQEIRLRYHNEYLSVYTFKEWAQYIHEEYIDLNFESQAQAKWEYLSVLRYYDLFLSTQFQASFFQVSKDSKGTMRKTQPVDCIFALRPLHIVVTDFPARKTLRVIHFFDINSWGKSEQGQNYFFVRMEDGSVLIFEFNDRNLADFIINSYVNWSVGKPVDSHLCQEFNDVLTFLLEKNN